MAIVKLNKVTLYGCEPQRDAVLRGLQDLGCVHLVDLHGPDKPEYLGDKARSEVHEAIKYLELCPDQRPAATHTSEYDRSRITRRTLINRRAHEDLGEEREKLKRAIAATAAWGDFELPDPASLGGLQLWLYRLRHSEMERLAELDYVWQLVSRTSRFDHVVVVSPSEPKGVPGRPVTLDHRSRSELLGRLEEVERLLERLDLERIALTRWIVQLREDMEAADDDRRLTVAAGHALTEGPIFAFQGWAPKAATEPIEQFARRQGLALTVAAPGPDDTPPTLLSNPRAVAGAEGAVTFYMTPSYQAWDPTWIMYVSFSLFFAMIMADAAYGVVMAIVLAAIWGKLGGSESGRRMRGLLAAIVAMTIGYGVLIGSYFGSAPPVGSLPDRFVWKSGESSIMDDQSAMMLLAATIGVFHLALANLINAWKWLGSSRALGHVGWAVALVGGLVMAIAKLPEPAIVPWLAAKLGLESESLGQTLWQVGMFGLGGGLGCVFLFSSERPFFSAKPKDWLLRPLEGLMGLTNISKAFGDSLSYLRLFALGLASAKLAVTFNGLASEAMNMSGIGILVGSIIFFVGHTLNLALGIVGGVVHGLRLNCIEFFSWSLTDEGYPFRAFCKKADR